MFFTGCEVGALLFVQQLQYLHIVKGLYKTVPCHVPQIEIVAQTTGVINQMANGHDMTIVGQFGEITADIVVERNHSPLRQQHYAGGGKLFGYGGYIKDRLRRNR